MSSERKRCATAFLTEAVAYYAKLGVKVQRVMTDNGSCYKAFAFRRACKRLGLKHIRTKPYTPKTNGKAEHFMVARRAVFQSMENDDPAGGAFRPAAAGVRVGNSRP